MALNGKIAVVTGAALGIGKAITEILLQNGATVVLLDVNENAGKSLKESLDKQHGRERTLFLNCNVESEEQLKAAFQKTVQTFGGVDILCNNAGIFDEGTWEKSVSINLVGVIRGTYLALELMNKLTGGRGGVIVNIASIAGLGPFACCPVYTATKYGVVGFTQAMAAASTASGYGIRFNALCPSLVQTDLSTHMLDRLGQFSHLADTITKYADKGVLNVSEVAECFLELVMDATKNGEALVVTPNFKKYRTFPPLTQ
ncbi:15-hydroxyprostaglandin dehydrogenase [NAD(+)]-like [Hippoglossus hippoglossus]|uniref:15-hydroxyprostaglandin dehydrogenase [NAD(+)]-like n=1 Tax=Hippoglossus hippoglossus TaxID=8267 RepID=UPI00148D8FCC|nr:15-hydroxyprostaglandin dehydrogenase [NAD(+)]-like [Hippoglossus hippoglossus]XP_034461661.1 15-hydroxyprostaglandin dehydrogenase [NAD(+)]-like [Hippoglossus hippoglossus]